MIIFIVSDIDKKMLILIKFNCIVSLKSIKIYANTNNDNDNDISVPKTVSIYKLQSLNVNIQDIQSLKPDKSIECSQDKLSKGQLFKFQTKSELSTKFDTVKFIAIYIESNQNDTAKTIINSIILKGAVCIDKSRSIIQESDKLQHADIKENDQEEEKLQALQS